MDGHGGALIPDNILEEMFPDDNELDESAMHISKCKKLSNWGIGQDRIIILSTHSIYLLSQKEVR